MEKGASFAQTYFMHKSIKGFGREGHDRTTKEMDQLCTKNVFGLYLLKT